MYLPVCCVFTQTVSIHKQKRTASCNHTHGRAHGALHNQEGKKGEREGLPAATHHVGAGLLYKVLQQLQQVGLSIAGTSHQPHAHRYTNHTQAYL
jgi:hypothetical protein